MKRFIFYCLLIISSCLISGAFGQTKDAIKDNEELKTLYREDQFDRMAGTIDWSVVSKRDRERKLRVYELLKARSVRTSKDYSNAAMIFQHGGDTTSSRMAVTLMKKAVELDPLANKWLLAAATDRYLLGLGQPQIYGTQFEKMGNEPWQLSKIDSTKITDNERLKYGVGTLSEQREKVKMMNKKKLSELLANGKTVDEVITFCLHEDKNNSPFNLSEAGINSFGYEIMAQKRYEEALKIFELNTKLYPKGFNAFDSYGEGLLRLGKKEQAIAAYKKSLELNPKNSNAEKAIAEISGK